MSFTDPSVERPRRATDRRRTGGAAVDPTVRRRRALGFGVGVVVLVALIFGVRGCRNAQQERALKDYVQEVGALVQESRQQSEGLFGLLRRPGDQGAVELQNSVNGFRVQAAQLVDRAEKEDAPSDLDRAQRYLVESLEFRRDGLAAIGRELPTALGDAGRRAATDRIARHMAAFLTSDVIYLTRVVPAIRDPLSEEQLTAEVEIPRSTFLPSIGWLEPATVGERLSGVRGGRGTATPGLHGTALGSVTVAGQTLTPGTPAELTAGPDLAVAVQVQNGGESTERDVLVRVSVTGGPKPIEAERRIEEIAAGGTETANIPLEEQPPKDKQVTIKVVIEPVPGEDKTDNNEATYTATFGG